MSPLGERRETMKAFKMVFFSAMGLLAALFVLVLIIVMLHRIFL